MGMGWQEGPRPSEKRVWNQIYQTMKEMLRSQESLVETLINNREFLEGNIRIQHELSSARIRFMESHVDQMKKEQAKSRLVESAKLNVLIGFKEWESLCYKKQLEIAESDLEDFSSCMEVLSAEMDEKLRVAEADKGKNTVDVSGSPKNIEERDQGIMSLKKEIKKLKHAYKNISSIKNTEVSALLAEKDFVWNQFRKMEGDYLGLLKFKSSEADQAKEAFEKLQVSVEKLQQSINEKDAIIARLEAKQVIMELDATKCTEEAEQVNIKMKDELHAIIMEKDRVISSLREELSKLKMGLKQSSLERSTSGKTKSEGKTEVGSSIMKQSHLQKCTRKHNVNNCGSTRSRKHRTSYGSTFETPTSDNVPRYRSALNEKRGSRAAAEMPSLFHTDFKIPKLKNSRLLSP